MTAFATETDWLTWAFVSTTPDSVTTPLTVVTLMSVDGMPFVAISSALTLVVIQVSLTGWFESLPLPFANATVAVIGTAPATASAATSVRVRIERFMATSSFVEGASNLSSAAWLDAESGCFPSARI